MTERVTPLRGESAVEAQASAWIARMDSDNWSPADQRELLAWVESDPAHRDAIRRLASLWGEMDALTALLEPAPRQPRSRPRRAWLLAPLAAVTAAVVLVTIPPRLADNHQTAAPSNLYTTALGSQREVTLPDGSRMHLNTRSYARVDFGDTHRRVVLLAGEAFFQVAHEPDRPFLVEAGSRVVRAVGTAFSVHMDARELEVLVTEGQVEVREPASTGHDLQAVALKAGQRVRVSGNAPQIEVLAEEDIERHLLWRQQLLGFTDTPLREVIAEYNRYADRNIVISDDSLRDMRIGGQFRTDDPEGLLEALETGFGVRVVRSADVILISRLDDEP